MYDVLPDPSVAGAGVYHTRAVMRSCDDDHGFCAGARCDGVPGYTWSHNGDWSAGTTAWTTLNLGIVGSVQDCADLCSNFAPRSGSGTCLGFSWNFFDGVCTGTADFRDGEPAPNDVLEAYIRCLTPDFLNNGWNDDQFLAPATGLSCAAAVDADAPGSGAGRARGRAHPRGHRGDPGVLDAQGPPARAHLCAAHRAPGAPRGAHGVLPS